MMRAWAICATLLGLLGRGQLFAQEEKYLQRNAAAWAVELKSSEPAQRRAAAFALGKLGNSALTFRSDLCGALIQDTDIAVRAASAASLAELGKSASAEIVPALLTSLEKDQALAVRRAAVLALGKLGDRAGAAESSLISALKNQDAGIKQNAAWALGQLMKIKPVTTLALIESLKDSDAGVRREAVTALGHHGAQSRDAVPQMIPLLRDKDAQEAVILALRQIGSHAASALNPLLELVESNAQPASVRQSALLTIEQVWPPGEPDPLARTRLERLARDAQPAEIRKMAAEAIENNKKVQE